MAGYDPATYGELVGDNYDALYPGEPAETEATVTFLASLARQHGGRSILDLGIGTGRIALPLWELGLRVVGVDCSRRMVDQLRMKPRGTEVRVVIGDYRTATIDERFAVVALLFNGILEDRERRAQIDIFRNAARHLEPGGYLVVESLVLTDDQRNGEWSISPRYVHGEHVELQFARYDTLTNKIERTLVHLRPSGIDFVTVVELYAAPGELDVIAETTGFRLASRAGGWLGEPFTSTSRRHVSVYELAPEES